MKIKVDMENCIACGSCEALASNTFKLNSEGKSEVVNERGDSDDKILEAAKSCPVSVISVWDDNDQKLWPEA
jgi:ferredoxin